MMVMMVASDDGGLWTFWWVVMKVEMVVMVDCRHVGG